MKNICQKLINKIKKQNTYKQYYVKLKNDKFDRHGQPPLNFEFCTRIANIEDYYVFIKDKKVNINNLINMLENNESSKFDIFQCLNKIYEEITMTKETFEKNFIEEFNDIYKPFLKKYKAEFQN